MSQAAASLTRVSAKAFWCFDLVWFGLVFVMVLFGGRGRGLSLCETLVSIDLVTGGKAAHAGAHL